MYFFRQKIIALLGSRVFDLLTDGRPRELVLNDAELLEKFSVMRILCHNEFERVNKVV